MYVCMNIYIYIYTCTHVCMYMYMCVYIYIYICISLSLSIYIYIYICVSLSLYIYISIDLSIYKGSFYLSIYLQRSHVTWQSGQTAAAGTLEWQRADWICRNDLREVGRIRLEASSICFGSTKTCHEPELTGMCVKNAGVRCHRIRDSKQYYFNSVPPTCHSRA